MGGRTIRERVVPMAVGFVVAVLPQTVGGWWLNSGRGVVITMAALFAAALGLCLPCDSPWPRAAAMSVGSIAGMAAALAWVGPGTIWPIVLVVAAVLTSAAVFAGALIARLIGRVL